MSRARNNQSESEVFEPLPAGLLADPDTEALLDEGSDFGPTPQTVVGGLGLECVEQFALLLWCQFRIGPVVLASVDEGIGSACVVAFEDGSSPSRCKTNQACGLGSRQWAIKPCDQPENVPAGFSAALEQSR